MFIYTSPISGYSIAWGQSYKQRAIREEEDGTFTVMTRRILAHCPNPLDNKIGEFKKTSINVSREQAREWAARWVSEGCTRENTRGFGLEDIDAEQARMIERLNARMERQKQKAEGK